MLVAYFDEVKYQKGRSPCYWLGAIVAGSELIWKLEQEVNELAAAVFGTRELNRGTEFHAAAIMGGNQHFKGWPLDKRIKLLKRLITIFAAAEGLGKIYVKINVEKMVGSDVEGMAFMFLVERVDLHLGDKNSPGLLIGDRESETASGVFAESLSRYRAGGTPYHYGKELKNLLDTVHFTHSHHSRMLQLADLHTWLRQFVAAGDYDKWHRKQIAEHITEFPQCLHANRLKEWPTDDAWVKPPAIISGRCPAG